MAIYFRNFVRIIVHIIFLPMARSIALMTVVMMAIHMLGTHSEMAALKQFFIGENYAEGLVIGGLVGFFKVLGAIGTVPMESDFSEVSKGIDCNDSINPATGLPLMNPGAGQHGGIDIHNNAWGTSHNEF